FHAYVDTVKETGFALELDFSALDLAESGLYTYSIITLTENATRESTIIANYELYQDELINVIKASELDSYNIYADGRTLKIDYNFVVIPEPSTYAAIFGALAIAFALMRRRVRK
ncbi:MAG: PEP-CTERM sorting domain-containing protein, partial [Opitutales bacterium]|nr:PEP-CTERM sorting domain-containing protein [Opitutales bacterium]